MYPGSRLGVRIYKDIIGEWRWTIYAGNGKALAVSSEGYHNKRDCEHALGLLGYADNFVDFVADLIADLIIERYLRRTAVKALLNTL
ncbi:MAG: DUF1508 domain-containing protein [Gammaproteobacteria bacterium]|nr:DUF1508 domain-containing protein [Gammaproteobacteria bacterium]